MQPKLPFFNLLLNFRPQRPIDFPDGNLKKNVCSALGTSTGIKYC